MTYRETSRLREDETIEVDRGQPVVCIPVYNAHEFFVRCLRSVFEHTPLDVPILVADDASPDPRSARMLQELAASGALRHTVYYHRREQNGGFVENVNKAFAASAPGDVVLLNSDTEVGPCWVELLREAAYSDSTIATATALTNNGTILSIPDRNRPSGRLPHGLGVDEIAVRVAAQALRTRPRIPTAIGHCTYIRRCALDLVGGFDTAFSPGYGEEVDFSQRCVLQGLSHVAADDVFVFHHGEGTFGGSGRKEQHEQLIAHRYPYYHATVAALERSEGDGLGRALLQARRAIDGFSVTIDARCLAGPVTGTQVHILELTHALARTGRVRIRVLVPPEPGAFYMESLSRIDGIELLRANEITPSTPRSLVVHRPYQVFDPRDLEAIIRLGERFVVTHQDLIAYRNPGYFPSFFAWNEFRSLTRITLASADRVLFFSQHAADDAVTEDLLDADNLSVALLGVDHSAVPVPPAPQRPAALPADVMSPFLLCMGTNFRHKNRIFALRLLAELVRTRPWDGVLVFAGPQAAAGTSGAEEAEYLLRNPDLAARVFDLAAVSEAEKVWLLEQAAGVVYPSVYEGFGLVPFEAAEHGTPCFFAAQTAVAETLPAEAATIVPWDPAATVGNVLLLLEDEEARATHLAQVRAAAAPLTWDRTAAKVFEAYETAVAGRLRDLVVVGGRDGTLAARLAARSLEEALQLPDDVSRALHAIVGRPALRRPFFRIMRLIYRTGYRARHRHVRGN